jgi:hypothetical protein
MSCIPFYYTDQPVAVFCGSIESDDDNYIPPFVTLEQMPPMTTLGNKFSVVEKENEIQTSDNELPTDESTQSTVAFIVIIIRFNTSTENGNWLIGIYHST